MTPTELRAEIQRQRDLHYEHACDLSDEGRDGSERAYGRVDAYDEILELLGATSPIPCPDCGAMPREACGAPAQEQWGYRYPPVEAVPPAHVQMAEFTEVIRGARPARGGH